LVWHRVEIQRTNAEISLTIDGLHTSFFDIPGKFFELNIKFGIYVGGLGNFNEIYLGKLHNFRGCIDQLFYNEIDVIDSASKANGAHEITYDCSNEFEATHFDAISFVVSGSYVILPGFSNSVRNGGTLNFDVKTSSSVAVLFYNSGSVSHQSDFISVEIINGRILLSINDGNGIVVLQSDVMVDDGFWHSVEIQFSPIYLEVSVDGKSRNLRPSLGDNRFFDLNDQLFVGGIELNKQSIAYQHGLQSILLEGPDSSLKGCLKGIKMGQKLIGLRDAQITKGVKSGECIWEFPCLIYDNSPCIEGAECFQEGLNEFRCLCDSSVCVKQNFTSHYKLFNTKQDNEAFIDVEILKLQPLNIVEGGTDLITNNLINVVLDYQKYGISESGVLFHIKQSPQHGILEVEVWDHTPSSHYTNIPGISDNVFTLEDLITEKVRYTHDGSENYNDSIIFELEFHSRFFQLPAFIHGKRHSFTFFIKIHPINDAPKIISSTNNVLKLAKNTKRLITQDILNAEDDDNSAEEIRYSVVSIINAEMSFIENVQNPDSPIKSFTQNDINKKLIRFVHKTKIANFKNNIKVLLTIFDKNEETADATLFVEVYEIELILVNNTGIVLPHNSFGLISATNLSYRTNSESELSQFIRFEIIKQSQFGNIQKLRGNGHWANVSFFSQRQINRNKIRYVHFKDKPNDDILDLQVSYNEIKAPVIHFRITFKTSQLRPISLNQLTINQEVKEITITNKELKFDTQPFPTATSLIIYTILSLPQFGSLHLLIGNTTNILSIGSLVTQKMIDEEMLIYNCSAPVYPPAHDSFDFEVATEGGLTNVEVSSFQ
jgi:chondroitin sulfate proteoglycan 4